MLTLINLLWIINFVLLVAIVAFIVLEHMDKDYPHRKEIKTNVKKYIDLVLNKLKIKIDEKYKNFTLLIIPVILYIITTILTNMFVQSQVNNIQKQAQDAINQVQEQLEQQGKNIPEEYKDMINK